MSQRIMPPHAILTSASTVPWFFHADSEEALQAQARWLQEELNIPDSFFAGLLGIGEEYFRQWKSGDLQLYPAEQKNLKAFWQVVLHVLSFLNFELSLVRRMLEYEAAAVPPAAVPSAPPWNGSSMRLYLEQNGPEGIGQVNQWVQCIRFANSY